MINDPMKVSDETKLNSGLAVAAMNTISTCNLKELLNNHTYNFNERMYED